MRPRRVDLAFDWMRNQPRRAFHYRDEVWAALAELHPDELAVSDDRKTPWFTLHRDMTQDARFLRGDKGMFELVDGAALDDSPPAEVVAVPDVKEPRVWIFQANPKFYRILEALQHLDRMQFLANQYKDRIRVGDIVLLWMAGNHAGIYAQARVADRKSDGDDAAFWADPSSGATTKPRVVLAIEKRFLGKPLLKTTIAATEGLGKLRILRQPNGTNFPVDADAWELLRPLLPTEETREPARDVLTWAMKLTGGPPIEHNEVVMDQSGGLGNLRLTGTRANAWEVVTPRGRFCENTWKDLVIAVARSFRETELLNMVGLSTGHVPYVVELPFESDRAHFYTPITDRVAVYTHVSARRAVKMCRWLSAGVGEIEGVTLQTVSGQAPPETSERPAIRNNGPAAERGAATLNLLGRAMREWRAARAVTQAQAAELVGCTSAAWGLWERGRSTPSSAFRRKVEEVLETRVSSDTGFVARGMASRALSPRSCSKPTPLSNLDRNRRLLVHLATFGELTPGDLEDLELDEAHLGDWLDSMLARRPEAHVVTPLFLHLIDGDAGPCAFTTRLAVRFMGEHLRRHAPEPIPELEEHVWTRFGRWHLTQLHGGDLKTHAYLSVPIREPRDVAASERLDLFAQLPPKVIGDLIREPEFLSEQQSWSADAALKSSEGPLSTQLRRNWKRPLLLSTVELLVADDGRVLVGEMERTDVMERSYVVAGLPLCSAGEWAPAATLDRDAAAERLFQHPVAAAVLQFEVHRLFAGLSGDVAALIHIAGGVAQLELDGVGRGPLWRHVRSMLEHVGYWPVGASTQDSLWATAVHVMLKNLELLDVLERDGDVLRLTDDYQSRIKAHPGHLQNRGEKPYRVRLSQFLATLHGGQA